MGSKYLEHIIRQAEVDHAEAVELIERRQKIMTDVESGFSASIDGALDERVYGLAGSGQDGDGDGDGDGDDLASRARRTLAAADRLIHVYRQAQRAVAKAAPDPEDGARRERARQGDREHVRAVLEAGKRVVGRECDAIVVDRHNHNQPDPRDLGSRDERVAQAIAVFGGSRPKEGFKTGSTDPLVQMEKGVRKMTKGVVEP